MRTFCVTALVVLAWRCSGPTLDRTKAASILESQAWGSVQPVRFSNEQLTCGVSAGLWEFQPGEQTAPGWRHPAPAQWHPTAEGAKLGLPLMLFRPVAVLGPGFSVSATVTGVADAGDAKHKHVEAIMAAKIAHPCFSAGVPFEEEQNGKIGVPIGFTFALFDDGWRVMKQ